jgi:MFS family permease
VSYAERIAALTPEQRELLSRRLLERARPVSVEPIPPPAEIPSLQEGSFDPQQPSPLSDIQEVFWMGGSGLFDLGGSSANIFIEYDVAGNAEELAGRLNPVLARAVARHPMLRTVVSADGMQRVLSEVPPYQVELVSLSLLPAEEIERHLESTRERLRYTRFRSDRWPLFDMVLSQLPGGRVRYQARFDAVVVDGPARAQLIDELVRGVVDEEEEGVRRGDPPAPAVTYLDHVRAVRAFRSSATWERCRAYWHTRLPSLPAAPRLPLARDFGPDTVPRIVKRTLTVLDPSSWATLCQRAAQRSITPSGLGTAMVAEVLRSWSEEPAFILGLSGTYCPPIHPEIRGVIGTFANLCLLEVEGGTGSFAERTRRLQDRLNTDLDHQHYSGYEALRELNRMRHAGGRATLPIQITSVLRSGAPAAPQETGPERATEEREDELRQVDLMIAMPQVLLFWVLGENPDRSPFLISQAVEDVFPPDLVADLMDGYRRLAERLAEDEAAWSEPRPLRLPAAAPVESEAPFTTAWELGRLAGLGPDERLLSLSLPGSDLALCEIQAAQEAGAAVILPAADERTPEALAALAVRERVTVWSSAPAVLESALHQMENDRRLVPGTLRRVLLHRDRVPAGLPARLRALGLDVQSFATWGAAGAPIAAAGPIEEAEAVGGYPPLRAAAGWRLHVLDRDLVPRPAWVPGDLYLSGGAEVREKPEGTGERACCLPDGRIELLGNEPALPAEALGYGADSRRVEAALQRHPSVRHAVVAWRESERRLLAWVLLRTSHSPSDDMLCEHLRLSIPEHLLPAVLIRLDEFPLTPEGWVDRSALAAPAPAPPPEDIAWSPRETELADLWEEILGRRPAASEDNFFELGGNSMLAARLINRVIERFGLEKPLASFLNKPTLACLADLVDRAQTEKAQRTARSKTERSLLFQLRNALSALRSRILPPPTSPAYGMRLYLVLWLGQFISNFGTGLGSFALGVWVYQHTGSATRFAMIPVVAGVVTLITAPFAGAFADRWNRRKLMLVSNVGSAAMTAVLASLLLSGRLETWHIYPFVAVMVFLSAIQGPALTSSISLLVPRSQLSRAAGLSQSSRAIGQIIGPFAAGFLVAKIGYYNVIYIDCSTFLFAAVTLLLVPIPNPPSLRLPAEPHGAAAPSGSPPPRPRRRSLLGDLADGWAYIRERPGLFALLSMYTLTNFCIGTVQVLLTPLILSFATPAELGSVNSAAAGGVLLGSLALSIWGGPKNRIWTIFAILVFQGCLLFVGGVEPSISLIALAAFGFMFTTPIIGGTNQAILQSKVAPEVQGRVFGMAAFIVACTLPLASALAGPLVDRVFQPLLSPGGLLAMTFVGRLVGVGPGRGAGLLFVVLGATVLLIVGVAFLNPRLRRIEAEIPDAIAAARPDPR